MSPTPNNARKGRQNAGARLTPAQVATIRRLAEAGQSTADIAALAGVTTRQVNRIKAGESWEQEPDATPQDEFDAWELAHLGDPDFDVKVRDVILELLGPERLAEEDARRAERRWWGVEFGRDGWSVYHSTLGTDAAGQHRAAEAVDPGYRGRPERRWKVDPLPRPDAQR